MNYVYRFPEIAAIRIFTNLLRFFETWIEWVQILSTSFDYLNSIYLKINAFLITSK